MTERIEGLEPDHSLSDIEGWVQTNEATWGPVFKIGNDGTNTGASFYWNDPAHPKPTVYAKVRLTIDGNAPAGTTKLCDGWPFVSGEEQHVVVYRPAA